MLVRFGGRNEAAGLVSATRLGKPAELGRLPAGLFRNSGGEREKWGAGRENFAQIAMIPLSYSCGTLT